MSQWLVKLGLTIHPTKTRLCLAREEPFDFLGYTFGPARHWLTGKRFLSARPSKKAQKRLKEKINALLYRGNPMHLFRIGGSLVYSGCGGHVPRVS